MPLKRKSVLLINNGKVLSTKRGFSVLEVILAVALFSIFSTTSVLLTLSSLRASLQGNQREVALAYAAEGIEIVRAIRSDSFGNLIDAAATGLHYDAGKWEAQGDFDSFEIYKRVVSIAPAQRDENGDIVSGAANDDANMKKVVSAVSWRDSSGQEVSVELESYLANWKW